MGNRLQRQDSAYKVKAEDTDGVEVANEVAAGGGMIEEAKNLATDLEDLAILDEAEGEGNDGEM